ncbi:formimidoylglutamate deiminase [Sphingomonas sp. CFBP 13720]|uniref:formimidoylglutamate deiminase n=1 Tax=Sphingomonas sp. CFBP 13720 TaxID=2775302 RepID=UPI00177BF28F|nr:formimidoylglutamate deiminase [Sphingomonas sp. CFBP 13720]MBD8679869.1 formimidoylglutamate deiminase [Sphingomonas sp. CFBP 13720]
MQSIWFEHALLPEGWAERVAVAIGSDGLIADVQVNVAPDSARRYGVGMPGMPNLHSHAFQRAMAGLTERRGPDADSFWTWREWMYRFAARVDPDSLAAIAALAYVEMLEAGFTRVGEFHYVHHQRDGAAHAAPAAMARGIVAAAAATGIGLTLLPVFYAASGFGGVLPSPLQRRFVSTPDSYLRLLEDSEAAVADLPDAIVGIAPHSLRAVGAEHLSLLMEMRPAAPIHIHIAEQQQEVRDCIAWSGQRPVEWLFAHADVGPRWCLVHATHVDATERSQIARSGATVGLCPITEANLGDGVFPAAAFMAEGGTFGIGSDSNVRIDVAEELRLLEYGQRLTHQARNVMARPHSSTGRTLFDGALNGGANALGTGPSTICVGRPADLLSLNVALPEVVGRSGDALLDAWIFARGSIDCVWRRGTLVVEGGRHRARHVVETRYGDAMKQLMKDG